MSALRIAALIVASAGCVPLVIGVFVLRTRLAEIQNWRRVEAQVSRAWMTEERGEESTSYAANYELSYDLDGRLMRATVQSEDPMLGGQETVQARLARHSAGSRGIVHVSPDDPSKVHLNRGMNGVTLGLPLWLLLSGAFLLLMALSLWLMGTPEAVW